MREVLAERGKRSTRARAACAPGAATRRSRASLAPRAAARAARAGSAAQRRDASACARSIPARAQRARRRASSLGARALAARAAPPGARAGASRGRGAARDRRSACSAARVQRAQTARRTRCASARAVGHHERRGGGRRGRAHVGDEVADREVGLVAHARHDRQRRLEHRARDDLLVERPQVLDRAAAARDDQHVDLARARWRCGSRARSRPRPRCPAPASGRCTTRSAGQRRASVVSTSRSAAARGEVTMPTARGIRGQRALALGGEPAGGLELRLEAREALVQRAEAREAHAVDVELELAARLVDRRRGAHLDAQCRRAARSRRAARAGGTCTQRTCACASFRLK